MSESEESRMVSDAIEGGVKTVNDLADYFSRLVGGASSVAELRKHTEDLSARVHAILTHLVNNPQCWQTTSHLVAVAAINEFYMEPVASNVCCGESFAVFRERTVRRIRNAANRQIEKMRSEKSVAVISNLLKGLEEVELQLAQEELHGQTRH